MPATFKVGDRVHVEFDGTVSDVFGERLLFRSNYEILAARAKDATLIVPPVKVGDRVTPDVLDRLPLYSAVASEYGAIAQLLASGWVRDGRPIRATNVSYWNAKVIFIGSGLL